MLVFLKSYILSWISPLEKLHFTVFKLIPWEHVQHRVPACKLKKKSTFVVINPSKKTHHTETQPQTTETNKSCCRSLLEAELQRPCWFTSGLVILVSYSWLKKKHLLSGESVHLNQYQMLIPSSHQSHWPIVCYLHYMLLYNMLCFSFTLHMLLVYFCVNYFVILSCNVLDKYKS